MDLSALLPHLPLHTLTRIDCALEGDWSRTVAPIWTPGDGFLGFPESSICHPDFRPSLELYFPQGWIGVRCCTRDGEVWSLDESLAHQVIGQVEAALLDLV